MIQQPGADDCVIATGETHTVREFLNEAFFHAGLDYRDYLVIDPVLFRTAEVGVLVGDMSKARAKLEWQPEHSPGERALRLKLKSVD